VDIRSILDKAIENNVFLYLAGEVLKYKAKPGSMTAELKKLIAENKQGIVEFLRLANDNKASTELKSSLADFALQNTDAKDIPISFAQQQLWLLHQINPDGGEYNIPAVFAVEGQLDLLRLTASVKKLIARHQVLRNHYVAIDGEPHAEVKSNVTFAIDNLTSDAVVADNAEFYVAKCLSDYCKKAFDLTSDLMIRVGYLSVNSSQSYMVLNLHHIASDGWSLNLLIRELMEIYQQPVDFELPALKLQYSDYARWQRNSVESHKWQAAIDYWQSNLEGAATLHSLPLDNTRPAIKGTAAGVVEGELSRASYDALNALSVKFGMTPFMLLQGMLALLYGKLSYSSDIVMGMPVANREEKDTQQMVGCFVNTLAIRLNTEFEGLNEFLNHVKSAHIKALTHQTLPFEKVVEYCLKEERSAAYNPLIQTFVTLEETINQQIDLDGTRLTPLSDTDLDVLKFDIVVKIQITPEMIQFRWLYDVNIFDESTIQAFNQRYKVLLQSLCTNSDNRLAALSILPEYEKDAILPHTCGESVDLTEIPLLPKHILQQCQHTPDAVAVIFKEQTLSYAKLEQFSGYLAKQLIAKGVGREVPVAVFMDRCAELPVVYLAILRAGGFFVPIDKTLPPQRIVDIVQDVAPKIIISDQAFGSLAIENFIQDSWINFQLSDVSQCEANENLPFTANEPEDLAYMIFTSGSTGKPKGVMLHHAGLRNRIDWMQRQFDLTQKDAVLQKTPYSFDVSVWEFLWPLCHGARLMMAEPDRHGHADYLTRVTRDTGVSIIHFVPSMLEAFLDDPKAYLPSAMRYVICSGEALSSSLVKRFYQRFPEIELHNLYGPTEATIDVSWYACEKQAEVAATPIGKPVQNTELLVLNIQKQLCPFNTPGELYIGGNNLARGYWKREKLTAERFVDHPFKLGEVLYKTGDLALLSRSGEIYYLGRTDHQVKVRGFRIELGEIEQVLAAHPSVKSAVAKMFNSNGSDIIVAFYKGAEQVDDTHFHDSLTAHLKANLPPYAVPSAFQSMPQWPLTVSGKIDRKRLIWSPENQSQSDRSLTLLEEFVVHAWQEVLGRNNFGPEEDFFTVGGNSILAMKLANMLQSKLGKVLHIVAVFEAPNVRKLSAWLLERYSREIEKLGLIEAQDVGQKEVPLVDCDFAAFDDLLLRQDFTPHTGTRIQEKVVFILSPPRSGSTLLRVMLSGHSQLFAPPELELMWFDNMADRQELFSGTRSFWNEGFLETLKTLTGDETQARVILAQMTEQKLPVSEVYKQLLELSYKPILVDKTPTYAYQLETLQRIPEVFENAYFIQLQRHPGAMLSSFQKASMEQILILDENQYSSSQLAELVWTRSYQNIHNFFDKVDESRKLNVWFEEMVADPESQMRQICEFLDVTFESVLLSPYDDDQKRMTRGVSSGSKMLGDVKFHLHKGINTSTSDSWRKSQSVAHLHSTTVATAQSLGYNEFLPDIKAFSQGPEMDNSRKALSFSQQRLWFIQQMNLQGSEYNMPAAFSVSGRLDIERIEQAMTAVIQQHQILSTVYLQDLQGPYLKALENWQFKLDVKELSALAEEQISANIDSQMHDWNLLSFDLTRDLMIAMRYVRYSDEQGILLFNLHHIAGDGWSLGILLQAFMDNYQSTEAEIQPLPFQYADFSQWQRAALNLNALQRQMLFWRKTLEGMPPLHSLPLSHARPAVKGQKANVLKRQCNAQLSEALQQLAQRHEVTLFMLLHGMLAILYSKYSNSNDIIIGTPVAGRSQTDSEALIGCFVNLLVLRCDTDYEQLTDYLAHIKSVHLGALTYQDMPFEKLVERFSPQRNSAYNPLIQLVFSFTGAEGISEQELVLPDVAVTPLQMPYSSKFDLDVNVTFKDGMLQWSWVYDSDLFDANYIENLHRHLMNLLHRITTNQYHLPQLSLLSVDEQEELLQVKIAPEQQASPHSSVIDMFRDMVTQYPNQTAISLADAAMSYQQLDERSNQLAHFLLEHGAKPDELVGLCQPRSFELVVGILAILKSGAAYLPMDPEYPAEHLNYILDDAQPNILLSCIEASHKIADHKVKHCVFLDAESFQTELSSYTCSLPHSVANITVEHLAYVIYTSGSTGKPKGVMVEQGNLLGLMQGSRDLFDIANDDHWCLFHSFCFDFSVWEICGALAFGGTLHLVPYEVSRDPEQFVKFVIDKQITVLNQTPTAFSSYQSIQLQQPLSDKLRLVILGGEKLEPGLLQPWFLQFGDSYPEFVNMYGITETTVHVTHKTITCADLEQNHSLIGETLPGLNALVLDARQQLAPKGAIGELYISGYGVTRGYFNQPLLTEERFIDNPFGEGRLYRTGDLVQFQDNLDMIYHGRADQQIKMRGFRIEPGEILTKLLSHANVSEACVVVNDKLHSSPVLVAYYCQESAVSAGTLRNYLKQRLPDHMVPGYFVCLTSLPRTINGKLDVVRLPLPDTTENSAAYVAPATKQQTLLCQVFEQVLGRELISLNDDFFSLGGDSMSAVQLVVRLKREGFQVQVMDIFRHKTPRELALNLQTIGVEENYERFSLVNSGDIEQLLNIPVEDAYPLRPIQQGMLYHTAMDEGSALYHDVFALNLEGVLDNELLREALLSLVMQQTILRTRFKMGSKPPMQLVYSQVELPFFEKTLLANSESEIQKLVRQEIQQQIAESFDSEQELLWRFTLIKHNENFHSALLCVHHAIMDGWSVSLFSRELLKNYGLLLKKQKPSAHSWPVIPQQVAQEISQAKDPQARDFWHNIIANKSESLLPVISQAKKERGKKQIYQVPSFQCLSSELLALAESKQLVATHLYQAIHIKTLSLVSGEQDVLTSMVVNARPEVSHSESTLGLFINGIPLRVNAENASWQALVENVANRMTDIYQYRFFPIADLLAQKRVKLTDVLFNYIDFRDLRSIPKGLPLKLTSTLSESRDNFNLVVQFERLQDSNEVALHFSYDDGHFSQEFMAQLGEYFVNCATSMLREFDRLPDNSTLLCQQHLPTLLDQKARSMAGAAGQDINQMIRYFAATTPQHIAVTDGNNTLSYVELVKRADVISADMLNRGIGRGDVVAILCDRQVNVIAGLLAVLNIEAVFLLMDTQYSDERLSYMVADADIAILMTDDNNRNRINVEYIFCLDNCDTGIQAEYQHSSAVNGNAKAYVVYTSGSTGKPKGILISRAALNAHINGINDIYRIDTSDSVLQFTRLGFDISIEQIFTALCFGARLVLSPNQLNGSTEIVNFLREQQLTVVNLPPMYAREVFQFSGLEADLPDLRMLVLGGETMPEDFVKFWRNHAKYTKVALFNAYGPAETTITSTLFDCSQPFHGTIVPVGLSVVSGYAIVLDKNQMLCPPNTVGEIHIGGARLGEGYLLNPAKDCDKFITDPYGEEGAILYRTGDLGSRDLAGNLMFYGRLDNQLKIRGYRIEPAEIEAYLQTMPEVTQAVVVTQTNASGAHELVAYIVSESQVIQEQTIREFCLQSLPDYMCPLYFVQLQELPLTANGKIDLKNLPPPQTSSGGDADTEHLSASQLEMAGLWQQVLVKDVLAANSDFFTLGGNSLSAMRLVSQIRETWSVEVPLATIFKHPVLRDYCAYFELLIAQTQPQVRVIAKADRSLPLRPSVAQKRLWFVDKFEEQSSVYNIPVELRIEGPLDSDALIAALSMIVQRHEVLHTVIIEEGGQPVQKILPSPEVLPVPVHNLENLQGSVAEIRRNELIFQSINQVFDISQDLMLRAEIIKHSSQLHYLAISLHHIAADAWSMNVLVSEMNNLYQHFAQGVALDVPELTVQYADYACWLNVRLEQGLQEKQLDYWREQLQDAPMVHQVPLDYHRQESRNYEGDIVLTQAGDALTNAVISFAKEHKYTTYMVLQSAFAFFLSKYSGMNDIVVGTPVAGRIHKRTEDLIGLFLNTLAIRSHIDPQDNFFIFLEHNKDTISNAFDNQELSFEHLVEMLNPERSAVLTPIFQILFSMQNIKSEEIDMGNLKVVPENRSTTQSKYDLMLMVTEGESEFNFNWHFSTELFREDTIHRMAANFIELLTQLLQNPDSQLQNINYLTSNEQKRIEHFTRGQSLPCNESFVQEFEKTVATRATATAVVCDGIDYSYARLNRDANQLAHYLVEQGSKPQDSIGICMPRCYELIVTMIAVNKAGGCYLCLDPAYPLERLTFMVADARVETIIGTQQLDELSDPTITFVSLSENQALLAEFSEDNLGIYADFAMYMVYTSGSTGQPKGISIRQSQAVHYCRAAQADYYLEELTGATLMTSHSFDMVVCSVHLPLLCGDHIRVIDPQNVEQDFLRCVTDQTDPMLIRMTPSYMNILLKTFDSDWQCVVRHNIVLGGEAYSAAVLEKCRRFFPKATYFNHYGLTEITVGSCTFNCTNWQAGDANTVPIGSSLPGYQMYVLNDNMTPSAIGVSGDLYIAGPGLAGGYNGLEALTAERFISVQQSGLPERLFATKDKACWNADGDIEYLGRQDSQINLRGYRIEPSEIEHCLNQFEKIQVSAVAKIATSDEQESLAAFIVFNTSKFDRHYEDTQSWIAFFKRALQRKLPRYMVPDVYQEVTELPLTPNGKFDRNKLQQILKDINKLQQSSAPETDLEKQIANVWRATLQREELGLHDNFFESGGNSLIAVLVCNQLHKSLDMNFPVKNLFEKPTISELAAWIEDNRLLSDMADSAYDESNFKGTL
jgi:amino acid adenylation domain-containing protein